MPPCDLLLLDFLHSILYKRMVLSWPDSQYNATALSGHPVTPVTLNPSITHKVCRDVGGNQFQYGNSHGFLCKTGLCRRKALVNSLFLNHNCVNCCRNSPSTSIPEGMQFNRVNRLLILHHTPRGSYSTWEFVPPNIPLPGND